MTPKTTALEMIDTLRVAFSELLEENEWMDDETRAVARQKANLMNEKIGYPDSIMDPDLLALEYQKVSLALDYCIFFSEHWIFSLFFLVFDFFFLVLDFFLALEYQEVRSLAIRTASWTQTFSLSGATSNMYAVTICDMVTEVMIMFNYKFRLNMIITNLDYYFFFFLNFGSKLLLFF